MLCPDLPAHKIENKSASMIASSSSTEVQLNTLHVRVRGNKRTLTARLLFDNGCERSYVLKSTVAKLGVKAVGVDTFGKMLFGGNVTHSQSHNKYILELSSLEGGRSIELEFLEEEKICGKIRRVPQGPWLAKLAEANLKLSDVGEGRADIQLLIGGDYFAELLTGNLMRCGEGLTALETKIGWTLSGRIPGGSESSAMSVTAISISESSVCELWDLEALGIRDDAAQKTRDEREAAAIQHFRSTVKREEDGRYVVALPWMDRSKSLFK